MIGKPDERLTQLESLALECAFPIEQQFAGGTLSSTGLKRRDLFAMAALQGLIAYAGDYSGGHRGLGNEELARRAYELADAMVKRANTP